MTDGGKLSSLRGRMNVNSLCRGKVVISPEMELNYNLEFGKCFFLTHFILHVSQGKVAKNF